MGIGAIPYQATISPAAANSTALANDIGFSVNYIIYYPTITTTSDGLAHTIIITNTGAITLSTKTLTVNGTDAFGNSLSESLTGPTVNGNVSTTAYFLTVTSIVLNSQLGAPNTINIGINANTLSPAYYPAWAADKLEVNVSTAMSGYSVQYTRSPIVQAATGNYVVNNYVSPSNWIWINWASSASGVYQTLYSPTAFQFIMTSYTSGQTLTFAYSQPRNY